MLIHINLISAQLIPNAIATLGLIESDKSTRVILILGDNKEKDNAQLLADFYRQKGFQNIETMRCGTSTDYSKIYLFADELYHKLNTEHPDSPIILNATGGTKAMSIAFTQVFDQLSAQSMAIYTDTQDKQHRILTNPKINKPEPLPYRNVLDIDDLLYLNHFKVDSAINKHSTTHDEILQRKDITAYLVELSRKNRGLFSVLNAIASDSNFGSGLGSNKQSFTPKQALTKKLPTELTHQLVSANLCTIDDQYITFTSESAARYLGGAWFEEYAYLTAIELGIEHVAMSVDGHWLGKNNIDSSVSNELDLVLIHNNQMLIIECKTINWQKSKKGQDTVLKLESLMRNLGGSHAKGILLSLFEFESHSHDRIKNIKDLSLLDKGAIYGLENQLKQWQEKVS